MMSDCFKCTVAAWWRRVVALSLLFGVGFLFPGVIKGLSDANIAAAEWLADLLPSGWILTVFVRIIVWCVKHLAMFIHALLFAPEIVDKAIGWLGMGLKTVHWVPETFAEFLGWVRRLIEWFAGIVSPLWRERIEAGLLFISPFYGTWMRREIRLLVYLAATIAGKMRRRVVPFAA